MSIRTSDEKHRKDRTIVETWLGPEVEPNVRVAAEFHVSHDKQRREYYAVVSQFQREDCGNYSVNRYAVFRDPRALVLREKVARFNEAKFQEFADRARGLLITNQDAAIILAAVDALHIYEEASA